MSVAEGDSAGRDGLVRLYPRLIMGGAENCILQYLEHGPPTHMVVTHVEGRVAERAKGLAAQYDLLETPRLPRLLEILRPAQVAHLHTINNHLLGALAAQLAAVPTIVQTLHNGFSPRIAGLVDHTIAVGAPLLELIDTPSRSSLVPNGVRCPATLPELEPWYRAGRPLRIVEVGREAKPMIVTLEDIARSGAFAGRDVELRVVGFQRDAGIGGLTHVGPLDDPYPEIARADLLVAFSRFETFGRTTYEAMGNGAVPVGTPHDCLTSVLEPEAAAFYMPSADFDAAAAGRRVLEVADQLAADPERHAALLAANHELVSATYTPEAMVRRSLELYQELAATEPAPRSFFPEDLEGVDLAFFGEVLDAFMDTTSPSGVARANRLPPRAQAIAFWVLAAQGAIPDPRKRAHFLRHAVNVLGARPAVLLSLARASVEAGRLEDAAKAYDAVVRLDPGHATAASEHEALAQASRR